MWNIEIERHSVFEKQNIGNQIDRHYYLLIWNKPMSVEMNENNFFSGISEIW